MENMDMSKMTMPTGMSGMTTMMPMPPMPMMKMYFHTGYESHILFENWTALNDGAVFGWCVLFFLLALSYELLKYYRQIHLANASVVRIATVVSEENGTPNNSSSTQDSHIFSCQTPIGDRPLTPERRVRRTIPMLSVAHIIQTALHMLQILVSYILMLGFMYFNVWICLAVILGAGVGYFAVGFRKLTAYSTIDDDHCH